MNLHEKIKEMTTEEFAEFISGFGMCPVSNQQGKKQCEVRYTVRCAPCRICFDCWEEELKSTIKDTTKNPYFANTKSRENIKKLNEERQGEYCPKCKYFICTVDGTGKEIKQCAIHRFTILFMLQMLIFFASLLTNKYSEFSDSFINFL